LWPFDIFMVIWYSFSRFGMLHQEKSGNPGMLHIGLAQASEADSLKILGQSELRQSSVTTLRMAFSQL
jgi:hypothetical protein